VIVDEAHKVKSQRGATYQFIEKIERDFILLLTATPLQNDLRELYNLVTLLRPGQLGTWPSSARLHLVAGDRARPRTPPPSGADARGDDPHAAHERDRRPELAAAPRAPPRGPPGQAEAELYQGTTEFLRRLYREGFVSRPSRSRWMTDGNRKRSRRGIIQLAVIHLRQRLCSSARALAESLEHLAQGERINPAYRTIAKQARQAGEGIKTHAKLHRAHRLLKRPPTGGGLQRSPPHH